MSTGQAAKSEQWSRLRRKRVAPPPPPPKPAHRDRSPAPRPPPPPPRGYAALPDRDVSEDKPYVPAEEDNTWKDMLAEQVPTGSSASVRTPSIHFIINEPVDNVWENARQRRPNDTDLEEKEIVLQMET